MELVQELFEEIIKTKEPTDLPYLGGELLPINTELWLLNNEFYDTIHRRVFYTLFQQYQCT